MRFFRKFDRPLDKWCPAQHCQIRTAGAEAGDPQLLNKRLKMLDYRLAGLGGTMEYGCRLAYQVRSQVGECNVLASAARQAVTDSLAQRGVLPADNAAAGLGLPASIQGKFVDGVRIDNGQVHCHFSSGPPFRASSQLDGRELTLSPSMGSTAGSVVWTCSSANIGQLYLPAVCRSGSN